jgi:RNA polymerase sigma-70 factor (ECF subfamily)
MKDNLLKTEQVFLNAYDEFSDAIFRYCYFRIHDRELAKDLTQETFIKTWQYLSANKNKVDNLKAFLYKVALNLIIDASRKKKTTSLDQLLDKGFEPSQDNTKEIENNILGKVAMDKINSLEDMYRDAVFMKYVEDMSVKDIAIALNETENNISVRIHRGLKKIKEILNQ